MLCVCVCLSQGSRVSSRLKTQDCHLLGLRQQWLLRKRTARMHGQSAGRVYETPAQVRPSPETEHAPETESGGAAAACCDL